MARGLHEHETHPKSPGTCRSRARRSDWHARRRRSSRGSTSAATPRAAAAAEPASQHRPPRHRAPPVTPASRIPCTTGTCPTVEAGPTSDLGTNPAQYAFIDLYDFPAGDSPEIALCADTAPLSKSAPLCSARHQHPCTPRSSPTGRASSPIR